ncbi:unnamed protein product [Pedinophyceae sp. YPF-701]|nr:unnamed protein product [Pedinophyceae sp. YPF-701]
MESRALTGTRIECVACGPVDAGVRKPGRAESPCRKARTSRRPPGKECTECGAWVPPNSNECPHGHSFSNRRGEAGFTPQAREALALARLLKAQAQYYVQWRGGDERYRGDDDQHVVWACQLQSSTCIQPGCDVHVVVGGPYCQEHARTVLGVDIVKCEHGLGLVAARDFRRGEFVCPYEGDLMSRAQMDQRYKDKVAGDEGDAPYCIHLGGDAFFDAARSRSIGSLANHAAGEAANCTCFVPRRGRKTRTAATPAWTGVGLRALRPIACGTPITWDYGTEYVMPGDRDGSGPGSALHHCTLPGLLPSSLRKCAADANPAAAARGPTEQARRESLRGGARKPPLRLNL